MARPGPKWDGKLYKPATWGGGLEPGTVEHTQVMRQRRDSDQVRQIMRELEAARRKPARWYLKSNPFWGAARVGVACSGSGPVADSARAAAVLADVTGVAEGDVSCMVL